MECTTKWAGYPGSISRNPRQTRLGHQKTVSPEPVAVLHRVDVIAVFERTDGQELDLGVGAVTLENHGLKVAAALYQRNRAFSGFVDFSDLFYFIFTTCDVRQGFSELL